MLKAWIDAGAAEASGSASAAKPKPKMEFTLDPASMGKPQGEPAMPQAGLSTEPVVASSRPNAIVALATSPWAPLVAVGGHKQILLYHAADATLLAVLPFPEGTVHVLRFTRDGGVLLAAGGRAAQRGLAVAFDVKTGERLFEVGNEYDAVLAADISPDRQLVALGGPGKVVRVYSSADNSVVYEARKHTDWITALAFSPDGVLLASGDRNGGLMVWEAATGREFYDLRGHSALITAIDWRLDSNMLASASDDGTARLWEMQEGKQVKSWGAHGGGTESVAFLKDGRILTAGRDRNVKLWDAAGAAKKTYPAFPDIATRVAPSFDGTALVGGDFSGQVRLFQVEDGKPLGTLSANPPTLASRIDQARQALAAVKAESEKSAADLATLQASAQEKANARNAAGQARDTAAKALADAQAALAAAEKTLAEAEAARTTAEKSVAEKNPGAQAAADRLRAAEAALAALEAQAKATTAPPPAQP
jgi:WD40 repeat protein